MRALTNEESRAVFGVLSHYIGVGLIHLIDRAGEAYCFVRDAERVYYVPEAHAHERSRAVLFGTFSRDGRFALHINSLDHIATYAKAKVWISYDGALQFVRGYHIANEYIVQTTKGMPARQGVVVLTADNVPLGFGITARAAGDMPKAGDFTPVVYHVANVSQTGCSSEMRGTPPPTWSSTSTLATRFDAQSSTAV